METYKWARKKQMHAVNRFNRFLICMGRFKCFQQQLSLLLRGTFYGSFKDRCCCRSCLMVLFFSILTKKAVCTHVSWANAVARLRVRMRLLICAVIAASVVKSSCNQQQTWISICRCWIFYVRLFVCLPENVLVNDPRHRGQSSLPSGNTGK